MPSRKLLGDTLSDVEVMLRLFRSDTDPQFAVALEAGVYTVTKGHGPTTDNVVTWGLRTFCYVEMVLGLTMTSMNFGDDGTQYWMSFTLG